MTNPSTSIAVATTKGVSPDALRVNHDKRAYAPGSTVEGSVTINAPLAQHNGIVSVSVKLQGYIETYVERWSSLMLL